MEQNQFFYPVLPSTAHQYAASLFRPIIRGESVTTIWVPMAGRRMENKFLIENISLFEKELPDYKKYILVYVEPLDLTEESLVGYLRLLGKSLKEACDRHPRCREMFSGSTDLALFDDENSTYSKLLEALKATLKKAISTEHHIVFFLGEFDELHKFTNTIFYNNLKSLWDVFRPYLHYVFLTVDDLSRPELTDRFGELNAAILQNILYIPIHNDDNITYFIERAESSSGSQLDDAEKNLIKDLCGGHPYLIKAGARILFAIKDQSLPLEKKRQILESHYEIVSAARRIYDLRTANEKVILKDICSGNSNQPESTPLKRLLKQGILIQKPNGSYQVFCSSVRQVATDNFSRDSTESVVTSSQKGSLSLNNIEEIVDGNGKTVDSRFTRQEYELLRFFLKNPAKLYSRESVSEVLWGENSYEKYSDWAIDQVMSKLRKKLKQIGSGTSLQTIRGRGYRLS